MIRSVAVACLALLIVSASLIQTADAKPNILLVMTDDQGYGDLACLGNPILKTPNIDALHAESARLTNYHVCPTCSPTRASLMTGRYAHATGVWHTIQGRSLMRSEETTIAEILQQHNYRTGIFGKWHLGDNYPMRPQDQGFEEVFIHGGGGVGQTPDYFGNDYADDTYFRNGVAEKQEGYCTDIWFDAAMDFMRASQESGKPFFCYIPTNAAHGPFNAQPKDAAPYKSDPRCPNPGFYGMIANIDDNMGRAVKFLKDTGLEEDTILIFTTDNGSAAGKNNKGQGFNAGMRGAKGSVFEGGHRVPMFVRWPKGGLGGGQDHPFMAAHIDVMPTLLELCEVPLPQIANLHGKSFAEKFKTDVDESPSEYVIDQQRLENMTKWKNYCALSGNWRLVGNKAKAELFDIQADPGQENDIASHHPDVVARLKQQYEDYWRLATENSDQPVRIPLMAEGDQPVRLTGHDWHDPDKGIPWHQSVVTKGIITNGHWTVSVPEDGRYQFELRRWPREHQSAPVDIRFKSARLQIGEFDQSSPLTKNQQSVSFTANLKKGNAKLKTWLIDEEDNQRGAYYVYVSR